MRKTAIVVGNIQITEIRANANLLNGESTQRGWRSHSKTNYSLGRVNGDANLINSRLNYLSDPDCIDMQVTTGSSGEKQMPPKPGTGQEPDSGRVPPWQETKISKIREKSKRRVRQRGAG